MFKAVQLKLAGTPESIPTLINLNYESGRLQLSLAFPELSSPVCLSFISEGFRVLDERELLDYWDPKTRAQGWLWKIESGGWFEQECQRIGFMMGIYAQMGNRPDEYLILGQDDCISVLSERAPELTI